MSESKGGKIEIQKQKRQQKKNTKRTQKNRFVTGGQVLGLFSAREGL
jgi:hypothetical protein